MITATEHIQVFISKEINSFLEYEEIIKNQTKDIQDSKNPNEALKQALKLSHIMIAYRALLIKAITNLKDSYNKFDVGAKALMKNHETSINQRLSYLDMLHSDLELIQRLSYANKINL